LLGGVADPSKGFYVCTSAPVTVGAFVTVRARDVAPEGGRRRSFEDASDRFIKRVAAGAGAHVCGDGRRLVISGDDIVIISAENEQQHAAGADDAVGTDDRHHHRAAGARPTVRDERVATPLYAPSVVRTLA
jgi:hypothetical protein